MEHEIGLLLFSKFFSINSGLFKLSSDRTSSGNHTEGKRRKGKRGGEGRG